MADALLSRDANLVAGCAATGAAFLALGIFVSDVALAAPIRGCRGSIDADPASRRRTPGNDREPRSRLRYRPNTPVQQFKDFENAPPMRVRLITADGRLGRPYVNAIRLVDRLQRRYEEDRSTAIPIRWWRNGSLASVDESHGPWLPSGATQ